ncbi:hypothetical protein [Bradyrhizobium sp.]|uniref:hypothetical protein n=1 Tax=Bradyrhizobium sp. TaxID=376 RepID=UPI003C77D2D5
MLYAETIAAITTKLAKLNLDPATATKVLAAVFAPLVAPPPSARIGLPSPELDKVPKASRRPAKKYRAR